MSEHARRHMSRFIGHEPIDPQFLPKPHVEIDPLTMSPLLQAALMTMHESAVRRAVVTRLLDEAQTQAKPGWSEYQALIRLGLCLRNPGKRFHELTPAGLMAAKKLEQKLCARFNLHMLIEHPSKAGWEGRFYCPCGWSTNVRRSPTAPGNARVQFNRHLRTVKGLQKLRDVLQKVEG